MSKESMVEKMIQIKEELGSKLVRMSIEEQLEFINDDSNLLHTKKWWAEKEKSQNKSLSKA
ncbi:hypothetical protein [Leptospira santarosai]|uniref:hypothetical protein n=1 Tax=Leptospira santarosai TaxID=28183 RepID=UPI0002974208|nr:hypothetical protein [Leptospira santarosai]EKS09219.1 hypothetical protein LEP1GSC071_0980 [Leptospira santarosai str. JET]EMP02755.1 hypothetical protein LEP1GSC171_1148 [Leptospira santarosai str. HAI1380]MDI7189104.1 hypothetical protein [Leptospira santarosai]MDI7219472.1 hypothetical protein [Leptospira santarosai]UZN05946.1 hypothetical protein M5D10_08715 [Leptospira santarosai]